MVWDLLSGSARVETSTRVKTGEGYSSEGVTGLRALGVRDLNYRLAFLACSVQPTKHGVTQLGWALNGDFMGYVDRVGEILGSFFFCTVAG